MTKEEYIEWATELIKSAVEIMTVEQLSKWTGVRAWQETRPTTGAVDLGWECGICKSSNLESDLLCGFCDTPRPSRKATIQEIIDWIEGGKTMGENRRNYRGSVIADELRKML